MNIRPFIFPDTEHPRYLRILALILIGIGAIFKIAGTRSMTFTSDTVLAGLISKEAWSHNNLFLQGHIGPYADPFYFPELYPLHFVTQVLSGYNADILRCTSLVVFFANVLVFTYIVFILTKSLNDGLVFAALMINLPPLSFFWFFQPFMHNGTMLIAGICLVLTLWYLTPPDNALPRIITGPLCLILLYLTYFSDMILGIWLIVPILGSALFHPDKKDRAVQCYYLGVLLCIPVITVIKDVFFPFLVKYPTEFATTVPLILHNFIIFVQSMMVILCGVRISNILTNLIMGITFCVLLTALGFRLWQNRKEKEVIGVNILYISVLLISFLFIFLKLVVDTNNARFLLFPGMAVYILILVLMQKRTIILSLFLIIAVIFCCMSVPSVLSSQPPHETELSLIEFLEEKGLTHGLGDYWDANLITYLSGEEVIIRAIDYKINRAGQVVIVPYEWNTFIRWIDETIHISRPTFILVKESQYPGLADDLVRLSESPKPSVIVHGDYRIVFFPANNTTVQA